MTCPVPRGSAEGETGPQHQRPPLGRVKPRGKWKELTVVAVAAAGVAGGESSAVPSGAPLPGVRAGERRVWRAGCYKAFMGLLAAAGGALDNHAPVTPTLRFPPPVWEGKGLEPQQHECLCGNHPHPTLPPQALSPVRGGLALCEQGSSFPKRWTAPTPSACPPAVPKPRFPHLPGMEAAQILFITCHQDHPLLGHQGGCT